MRQFFLDYFDAVSNEQLLCFPNILKHGFTYCGIIYLLSGDERLAYQKEVNR